MEMCRDLLPVLLGYVLRQESVPAGLVSQEQWPKLMETAARHKVLSTLACILPLLEENPSQDVCERLEGVVMQQMLVSSNQLFAAQQLQQTFEEQGIFNLTLKGIHTKMHYPQDYMRTMGDLDVLCKAEQNAQVRSAMHGLDYTGFEEGRKHDHYSRKPYINVEIHRQLVSASSEYSHYYDDIWQRCQARPGCSFSYVMSVEDEYLFHLVHLVEHFKQGGVGVRFIMDIYVYENRVTMDREYLERELNKLGLMEFYEKIVKLAGYWFGEQKPDPMTLQLASFILSGGVYGSRQNAQALSVTKKGRAAFLIQACFPPLGEMGTMFPWVMKFPILLPVAWLIRGVRSLLYRRRNIKAQLDAFTCGDVEYGRRLRQFYRDCGLK